MKILLITNFVRHSGFSAGIYLILFFVIVSCNKQTSGLIEGIWSIDEIHYKDQDYRIHIRGNYLSFNGEQCDLPKYYPVLKGHPLPLKKRDEGIWHTTEEDGCYFLHIETTSKLFNGRHKVVFWKDEKEKLVKMTISSKDLYLVCRKGLFNFDLEAKEWDAFFHEENCVEDVGV